MILDTVFLTKLFLTVLLADHLKMVSGKKKKSRSQIRNLECFSLEQLLEKFFPISEQVK